ncbi:MAG: hypothetical protein ACOC3Z_03595 [Nanoarchaeota archaeon]
MKVKDLKKIIENIPEKYDDYDIVYSEVQDKSETTYQRIDDTFSGMVSDEDNKKICLMGYESYQLTLKYNNLKNE